LLAHADDLVDQACTLFLKTNADYKAVCSWSLNKAWHWDFDRARAAALAQPEPEGPSKAELRQIFDDQSGFINDEQVMWWSDFQLAARAVLARWGNL
jgi:hypothetical protein